jgi:hypothetical protein
MIVPTATEFPPEFPRLDCALSRVFPSCVFFARVSFLGGTPGELHRTVTFPYAFLVSQSVQASPSIPSNYFPTKWT